MDKKQFYTNKKNIVFLAIICCALWGSAYPAIKIGYELFDIAASDTPTKLIFAGYRFTLAGLAVLALQVMEKKSLRLESKKVLAQVGLLGLTQTTIQYICFYIGLANTTGINGSIINGTGTFFSIILAHFIYKNDRINLNKIIGCTIGFLGVIIVNLGGGASASSSFALNGEGLVMLSAFTLSASAIYGKKITQKQDATIITGYQLTIGGVILTALGVAFGGSLGGFTVRSVVLLVYMALLSSVAFVLWSQLMKYNKVGTISMFNFLIPVFGTLLSAVFLGENIFDVRLLVSLALVCAGIFIVYRKSDVAKSQEV